MCADDASWLMRCRRALTADRETAEATATERKLGWYAAGQHIALDVARGLHFLHKSGVSARVSTALHLRRSCLQSGAD